MAGKQLSLMRFLSKTKASDCTTSGATGGLSQDDSRTDRDETVSENETGSESGDQHSHKMTVDMRILVIVSVESKGIVCSDCTRMHLRASNFKNFSGDHALRPP